MPQKIYVAGKWIATKNTFKIINPYNQQVVEEVYQADKSLLEQAVQSATKVFEITKKLPTYQKTTALFLIASELEKQRDVFAKTIALESGKPLKYSLGEVDRAVSTFRLAGEVLDTMHGEVLPLDITQSSGNKLGIVKRFPIGPVFGISPFNFPLNLVSHKVAPALATGNPIILKPASATPLTALKLAELFDKTNLPKEMLQVIPCDRETADLLVEDQRFAMISFTGSPVVGWELKKRAGKKKVVLELGGDAAVYIHKDADIDFAVKRCLMGSFAYAGQVCISIQRIFIHETVYDNFLNKLLKGVKDDLKIGDQLDLKTDVSAMIDAKNVDRIMQWIEEAKKAGAKILIGGTKTEHTIVMPTVLENPPPSCSIVKEEAFGPIVNVYKVKNSQEAFEKINSSKFGLQTGIFTNNHTVIYDGFEKLEVGGVVINDVPTFRADNMPYGGIKDSGFGREGLKYAIEDMTELKLLVINRDFKGSE